MARLTAGLVGPALRAMSGASRIERACVPEVAHYTLTAAGLTNQILAGLVVRVDRLRANAVNAGDALVSERPVSRLGVHIGEQTARDRIQDLGQRARDPRWGPRDLLAQTEDLAGVLCAAELDGIVEPPACPGGSVELTAHVIAFARTWLGAFGPVTTHTVESTR